MSNSRGFATLNIRVLSFLFQLQNLKDDPFLEQSSISSTSRSNNYNFMIQELLLIEFGSFKHKNKHNSNERNRKHRY